MKRQHSSKVLRHELAREKYREFESTRAQSRPQQENLRVPQPGEFFVQPAKPPKLTIDLSEPDEARLQRPFSSKCYPSSDNRTQNEQQSETALGITKSIKVIVNRQNTKLLSPTSKVIPELINKRLKLKTEEQISQPVRPISAQLFNKLEKLDQSIDNCELLQKAYEFDRKAAEHVDRKPTTFLVKQRKKTMKHIQGYNTVTLKREDIEGDKYQLQTKDQLKGRVSPYLTTFELPKEMRKSQQQPPTVPPNFLPLEYYMLDDLAPEELLKLYGSKDQPIQGFSKWFDNTGGFEWRRCTINGYEGQSQRWSISWSNGQNKLVSRSNLRFAGENEANFKKKLVEAESYRNFSEIYYKYNCMIDLMQTPTSTLPVSSRERIVKMVQGWSFRLGVIRNPIEFNRLTFEQQFNRSSTNGQIFDGSGVKSKRPDCDQLLKEVAKLYTRTNHQIEFDSTLPFSEQRKSIFYGYLPKRLFESMLESAAPQTNNKGCIKILKEGERAFPFLQTFSKVHELAHIANPKRLAVLQQLRFRELEMERVVCWQDPGRPVSLQQLNQQWEDKVNNVLHQLSVRSCDTEHEIGNEMDNFYLERRTTLDEEGKRQLSLASKFQFLANHRFELLARSIFERTLQTITAKLNNSLEELLKGRTPSQITHNDISSHHRQIDFVAYRPNDLLIELVCRQENGDVVFSPTAEQIRAMFQERKADIVSKFTEFRTIDKCYLEPARPDRRMKILDSQDEQLLRMCNDYSEAVERILEVKSIFRKQVQIKGRALLDYNLEAKRRSLKKGSYDDFQVELRTLHQLLTQIEELMLPRKMRLGVFLVDCTDLRSKFRQRIYDISGEVYRLLLDRIKKDNERLSKTIDGIIERLRAEPTDVESMSAQLEYAERGVNIEMESISGRISEVMQNMDLLTTMNYRMAYEDFQKCWQIYSKPMTVKHRQQKCIRNIEQYYRKQFSDELSRSHDELVTEVQEIGWKLEKYTVYSRTSEVDLASQKFAKLGERLDRAQQHADLINSREALLKWKPTDFSELAQIRQTFNPYYKLWTLAKNFNCTVPTLLTGPFSSIDKKLATEEIEGAYTELEGLEKNEFKNNHRILKLVQEVRGMYGDFRRYLPLINGLRNPDLRDRHWEKVAEATHIAALNESFDGSLQTLLNAGIMDTLNQVTEISEIASRELSYEKLLNKLKKDWREAKLTICPSEEVSTVEELQELLERIDRDMVKVQAIIGSPFVKFLEQEVVLWRNSFLYKAQEVFELLNRTQQLWLTLYPIFLNKNIEKDLSEQYSRFQNFDKAWRALCQQLNWQPMVSELIQTRIRDNLQYMLDLLEQMARGLVELFDLKRSVFARFYFLSDEEMLSIYSQCRSLEHFRLSARLCFDEADDLQINDQEEIEGVVSSKEVLKLSRNIKLEREAPLEEQFMNIEKIMRESLRQQLEDSFRRGNPSPLKQLAHLYSAILWTDSTIKALTDGTVHTLLLAYSVRLEELDQDLRANQRPSNLQSTTSMLILQVLHQRDILQNILAQNITEVTHFGWQSCLRNYLSRTDCTVSLMNLSKKYSFEYLGMQQRIVITPTTDRCMRSLAHSLDTYQIGCVHGASDSGKTSTVNELANTFGKRFIILSCSQLTERASLVRIFQGMCTSGAWVCLQHFDRLQTEMMSVLAQLVKSVQQVQSTSSRNLMAGSGSFGKLKSAIIEDKHCPIDVSYALFLTSLHSNQQVVPDSLRVSIRPVGIVQPHEQKIVASLLMSYGYINGEEIAAKTLGALRTSRELIVPLNHYSFGLRTALFAVQKTREIKGEDEYRAMFQALVSIVLPFLSESDRPLLIGILNDFFPDDSSVSNSTIHQEEGQLASLYERDGYEFTTLIQKEAKQIEEAIHSHPAIIVCGQSMTGKSTIIQKLSEASGSTLLRIFPKATPLDVLFGKVNANVTFQHGVLSKYLKYSDRTEKRWICFDGGIDSLWVENLNPVMEMGGPLTLASGEKLTLHAHTRLIFETDGLDHASPNFVARCGKVYLQNRIQSEYLLNWWLGRMPACLQHETAFYRQLVKHLLEPMIQFVGATINSASQTLMVTLSQNAMMSSFLRIFESMRLQSKSSSDFDEADSKLPSSKQKEPPSSTLSDALQSEIFGVFVFAVVWSFGSVLNHHSRKAFSKEFKHLCKRTVQLYLRNIAKSSLPFDELSLFEAMFDGKEWRHWSSIEQTPTANDKDIDHLVFTTVENVKNNYMLKLLLSHGHSMLLVGQTSSGKNTSIEYFFSNSNAQRYLKTLCSFGQHVTLEDTLAIFQRRIEKQRRSKNSVGPVLGKISLIYINDISMAKKDEFDDQPSHELIRQWFVMGGWHDAKGFKRVEDIAFCSSCSQAEKIPTRLMRYLNPVWNSDEEDWPRPALKAYITSCLGNGAYTESLLKISFNLQKIVAKEFKPQPQQEFVRFGFKDTLEVLMNVVHLHPSYFSQGDLKLQLLKAWIYECRDCYSVRLTESQRTKLYYSMNNVLLEEFGMRFKEIDDGKDSVSRLLSTLNAEKIYTEESIDSIQLYLESTLSVHSNMHITLFTDTIRLLSKLNRALSRPNGNALIVGGRGFGLKEMCSLTASVLSYKLLTINSALSDEWKEVAKQCIRLTSSGENCILYVPADSTSEIILSEINSFMKIGCFTTTFNSEDIDNFMNEIEPNLVAGQLFDRWNDQMAMCRKHLRIVVVVDPNNAGYRQQIRNYSGFFDRAVVLYLQPLGTASIEEISKMQLSQEEDKVRLGLCGIIDCINNQFGKHVLPWQIEHFIRTFQRIYSQRQERLSANRSQYVQAINRIEQADQEIAELEGRMRAVREESEKETANIDTLTKSIEAELAKKLASEGEHKEKEFQLERIQKVYVDLKKELEAQLSEVTVNISLAKEELRSVEAKDMATLTKLLKMPSSGVRLTLEMLFVLAEKKRKEKDEQPWKEMVKDLCEPNSKGLKKLLQLEPSAIGEKIYDRIKAIADKNPRQLIIGQREGKVIRILNQFCVSVLKFCQTNKLNEPLRQRLTEACKSYELAKHEQGESKQAVNLLRQKLDDAQSQFNVISEQRKQLKDELASLQDQIDRIRHVKEMFAGDITQWKSTLQSIGKTIEETAGDCMLAAATITFLSALPHEERAAIRTNNLRPLLQSLAVSTSNSFSMPDIVFPTAAVKSTQFKDLSNDATVHENAALYFLSQRIVLVSDPHQQFTKWVVSTSDPEQLTVVRSFHELESKEDLAGQLLIIHNHSKMNSHHQRLLQSQKLEAVSRINIVSRQQLDISDELKQTTFRLNFAVSAHALSDYFTQCIVREEEPNNQDDVKRVFAQGLEIRTSQETLWNSLMQTLAGTTLANLAKSKDTFERFRVDRTQATELAARIKEAHYAEERVLKVRNIYEGCGRFAANLYLRMSKMSRLCPTYEVSIEVFLRALLKPIREMERQSQKNHRLRASTLEKNTRKSLFTRLSMMYRKQDDVVWNALFVKTVLETDRKPQLEVWGEILKKRPIDQRMMDEKGVPTSEALKYLLQLQSQFRPLRSLAAELQSCAEKWTTLLNECSQGRPPANNPQWTDSHTLLLLKIFRPSKFARNVGDLAEKLSESQSAQPIDQCTTMIEISSPCNPCIVFQEDSFVEQLVKAAQQRSLDPHVLVVTAHTESKVIQRLELAWQTGGWLILQNCEHYEKLIANIENCLNERSNESRKGLQNFRVIFLVRSSNSFLGESLLARSVKVRLRYDLKSSMLECYRRWFNTKADRKFYNSPSNHESEWKKMFFVLSLVHSVIRGKLGHNGWIRPFSIEFQDLDNCFRWVRASIERSDRICQQSLRKNLIDCIYGSRVQCEEDAQVMKQIIQTFVVEKIINDPQQEFVEGTQCRIPRSQVFNSIEATLSQLSVINLQDPKLLFIGRCSYQKGEIEHVRHLQKAFEILKASTQSKSQPRPDIASLKEIMANCSIDAVAFLERFPPKDSPLNNFILSEASKLKTLLDLINDSLSAVEEYLNCQRKEPPEYAAVNRNEVPQSWLHKGYASNRSLLDFLHDVKQKVEHFEAYIGGSLPAVNLAHFFNPQGLLTSMKQEFCRKNVVDFDEVTIAMTIEERGKLQSVIGERVCATGIYLHECDWKRGKIVERLGNNIDAVLLPAIHLEVKLKDEDLSRKKVSIPLYREAGLVGPEHELLRFEFQSQLSEAYLLMVGVRMACQS